MKNSVHIIDPLAYEVARRESIKCQGALIHSGSWRNILSLYDKRKLFLIYEIGKKKMFHEVFVAVGVPQI